MERITRWLSSLFSSARAERGDAAPARENRKFRIHLTRVTACLEQAHRCAGQRSNLNVVAASRHLMVAKTALQEVRTLAMPQHLASLDLVVDKIETAWHHLLNDDDTGKTLGLINRLSQQVQTLSAQH